MAAKKAASAAADKKRKRDKAEDGGLSKKRKAEEKKNGTNSNTNTPTRNGKQNGQVAKATAGGRATTWRLSEPMGGSIQDIDPVFTQDEEYIILTYTNLIQVYSTQDSLLERRIKLPNSDDKTAQSRRIVATALSPKSPELVWIGCSDGSLFRANWATGEVEHMPRKAESPSRLVGLSVQAIRFRSGPKEVLFLSEGAPGAWHVSLYDVTTLAKSAGRQLFSTPKTAETTTAIENLRTINEGKFLAGSSGKISFVGKLRASKDQPNSVSDLVYEVVSFDAADEVASLDMKASVGKNGPIVDLLLGTVRGAIFVYIDAFTRLRGTAKEGFRERVTPRIFHWHKSVVNSVKWSRDGSSFISGGTEQVLVVWQMDSNRKDYLPHLSATIENIVVSPRGASFALHLDDNSAMILTTQEMRPTTYIAGLQSLAFAQTPRKDANVRRAWQPVDAITRPIPAVVDPTDASRVCLRVGNGQKSSKTGETPSASNLQTFDVSTFQSVTKQPLARTNPTDVNLTTRGFPITEPTITQLCTSHDGQWLASVDEWQPPPRDISGISGEPSLEEDWARSRREVHLKFWSLQGDPIKDSQGTTTTSVPVYELVTRVDEAHFTTETETIFGVAADSRHANRFATLGDDGVVRFWGIKVRVHDGIAMVDKATGRSMVSWYCTKSVPLPLGESDSKSAVAREGKGSDALKRSGALTFSEDGSTVFAAFGARDEAVLYTIDAESGAVRDTLEGMFRGDVRGVGILGSSLVLLSSDLRVYDIVADELQYGIRLLEDETAEDDDDESESSADKKLSALTQLALGQQSRTFVVAVPEVPGAQKQQHQKKQPRPVSKVMVFSPDHAKPLFVETLPTLVVSLLPAVGLSGFLAIDGMAQMWSVVDAVDTAALGKPLSELNLPVTEAATEEAGQNDDDEDDDESAGEEDDIVMGEDNDDDDDDDDDGHMPVIAREKLHDIFDAAPATSTTSIDELFWQVTGLLAALPAGN